MKILKTLLRIIGILLIVIGLAVLTQTPGGVIYLVPGIILFVLGGRNKKKEDKDLSEKIEKASEKATKASEPPVKSVASAKDYPDTFVAIDLETTGIDTGASEILQIAAVKVVDGIITDTFSSYVRPIGMIPAEATAINHITEDIVADAPDLKTVLAKFLNFIDTELLIGYNLETFDLPILKRDLSAEVNYRLSNDYIDVYQLARYSARISPRDYKLISVAEYFHLNTEGAHDAVSDCNMTIGCYLELCKNVKPKISNASTIPIPPLTRPIEHDKETKDKYLNSILKEYPDFTIKGKNICLSGNFDLGDEPYLLSVITKHGGTIKKTISSRVDFLIMGNRRKELWMYGAYGTKLVAANNINEKGGHIVIVSESVLKKYLSENE